MKKSIIKLFSCVLILAFFIMTSISLDPSNKGFLNINNLTLLARNNDNTCVSGTPKKYYVMTNDNMVDVRECGENSTECRIDDHLAKCSPVTSYCQTSSGWHKINSNPEKYVFGENLIEEVDFTITKENVTIYQNLNASFRITMSGKTGTSVTTTIKGPDNSDKTSDFSISRSGNVITISKNKEMPNGDYIVSVTASNGCASSTKTIQFAILKKFYNYETNLTSNNSINYEENENTWTYTITKNDTSMDNNRFNLSIYAKNPETNDYSVQATSLFNITTSLSGNRLIYTLKNKVDTGVNNDYASAGDYEVRISYSDSNYVTGTLKEGNKRFTISETVYNIGDPRMDAYRYKSIITTSSYDIRIKSVNTNNNREKIYVFDEHIDGAWQEISMSEVEMNDTYRSLNLSEIDFINGNVVIRISETSTNYISGAIYKTSEELSTEYPGLVAGKTTVNDQYVIKYYNGTKEIGYLEEDFEIEFPTLYGLFKDSGLYEVLDNGKLAYKNSGKGTKNVVTRITLTDKQRIPLSTTGGYVDYYFDVSSLKQKDLEGISFSLSKNNQKIASISQTKKEDISNYITFKSDFLKNNGLIKVSVDFRCEDSSYNGNYTISLIKKESKFFGLIQSDKTIKTISLDITNGNTNFFLYTEIDRGVKTDDPLNSRYPNSNKKYLQQIGFYMIKGTKVTNEASRNGLRVKIFNKRVTYDERKNYVFFDEINYVIKLKKRINNNITFDISYDEGINYEEDQVLTENEFESTYPKIYEMLPNYTFDSETGELENDNFDVKIISYLPNEDNTDMVITYQTNDGVTHSKLSRDFNEEYPTMYKYIVTRFYIIDGEVQKGYLTGFINVTNDINTGEKITGREVTENFTYNITSGKLSNNIISSSVSGESEDLIINIVPKTEVEPGEYYVYVDYNNEDSIGYLNDLDHNDPEEIPIPEKTYPELWERNTHMTIMKFSEPEYTIDIDSIDLTTTSTQEKVLYTNLEGTADVSVKLKYIYDINKVRQRVEYLEGEQWVDVTNDFEIERNLVATPASTPSILKPTIPTSHIILTTNPNKNKRGTYRVVLEYVEDDTVISTSNHEFEIDGEFYELQETDSTPVTYIRNSEKTETIVLKGLNTKDINNFKIAMNKVVDSENYEELTIDTSTKTIKDAENIVYFKYDISHELLDDIENTYEIKIFLTNVLRQTPVSRYDLISTYQVSGENPSSITTEVDVLEDQYTIELTNEKAVVNNEGMYLKYDIETEYFTYDELDEIEYRIVYRNNGAYEDVSSEDSPTRMFVISDSWESRPEVEKSKYTGTLNIKIIEDEYDIMGYYKIIVTTKYNEKEFVLNDLYHKFLWNIEQLRITSEVNGKIVEGYYKNLNDTTLEAILDNKYDNTPGFAITKSCMDGAQCNPETVVNYNDLFEFISFEDNIYKIKLKDKNNNLLEGEYALVIYYSNKNYRVSKFTVLPEYANIKIDDEHLVLRTKVSDGKYYDGYLFTNKPGYLEVPLIIDGITSDDVLINITRMDGVTKESRFIIDNNSLKNNILKIEYNPNNPVVATNYVVNVKYTTSDNRVIEDNLIFRMDQTYFNFIIGNPVHNPNPSVPNTDNNEITFSISTDEVMMSNEIRNTMIKEEFINNIKIYKDLKLPQNEMTNLFEIDYTNTSNIHDFIVRLKYQKDTLTPGIYILNMEYTLDGTNLIKEKEFIISDYQKTVSIDSIDITSEAFDELIHKNLKANIRLNINADYYVYTNEYTVVIKDKDDNDVTNKFDIQKHNEYVDVIYEANVPYIDTGKYDIVLTHTDPTTGRVTILNNNWITIYDTFRNIPISNITPSDSIIYADKENQYYEFDLDNTLLTEEELDGIKARIYDKYGNIVYSNIEDENVTNLFSFEKISDIKYKINIEKNKARVDSYFVVLCIKDIDDSYFESNKLTFTIDDTIYKINIQDSSYVRPYETYNNQEIIYDYPGIRGKMTFTSTNDGDNNYSIKVFNKGKLVNEITDLNTSSNSASITTSEFISHEVGYGEVDIAICLNGLPYDSIKINTQKYTKVTNISVAIKNQAIDNEITLNYGDYVPIDYLVTPSDATNKSLKIESLNTAYGTITGNRLRIINDKEFKIKISNLEYSKIINIKVNPRIKSTRYEINQTNQTIFIKTLDSTKKVTKSQFLSNISNIQSNYKLYTSKNVDITNQSSSTVIGTNYRLVTGNETYYVILIGDLNGNGTIEIGDISYLYQLYRKKVSASDQRVLKAAQIRKVDKIEISDISKLYQFYRGKINAL